MKKVIFILTVALAFVGCKKDNLSNDPTSQPNLNATSMADLVIPSSFDFKSTEEMDIQLSVNDLTDQPLNKVKVTVRTGGELDNGEVIATGFTNLQGDLSLKVQVPKYHEKIVVQVHRLGFKNAAEVNIAPGLTHLNFGGSSYQAKTTSSGKTGSSGPGSHAGGNYYFMGSVDNQGVPSYLVTPDVIDQATLNMVAASLPEGSPVPTFNPGYLAAGNETDIHVVQSADIWVTFVHEGAGYRNTLGYYVYDSSNPPSSRSDIDSIHLIFPNASFSGSGGGLSSGMKVHLGAFDPGVSIGWVLIPNGWNNKNKVNLNRELYSNPDFNPEANASDRQHIVQLYDSARDLVLIGFEDIRRDYWWSCDNDFNDLVYYVTANPITAITTTNMPTTTPSAQDSDGDGVADTDDEFPDDALRSASLITNGTLTFEDLYPYKGDYDFNDLVAEYSITQYINANNNNVDLDLTYSIDAVGSGKGISFGVAFDDLLPGNLASVSSTTSGINPEVEVGTGMASVMLINDVFAALGRNQGHFFNTMPNQAREDSLLVEVHVMFTEPVSSADLGLAPFNPFIVPGGNPASGARPEVHLADYAPTGRFDTSLLGYGDDDSNAGSGRYFKTEQNLPWALNIPGDYKHLNEYTPIISGYNFFAIWAQSNGAVYNDWYQSKSGYRNTSNLY